jgi:large subunit ribosomal protein L18
MHIYAQLIDDLHGVTLAAASSCGKNSGLSYGGNIAAAREVGRKIAELAKAKGITQAVFDRGSYRFHGRVAALAIAATEAGLKCTDPEAIRAKQEARAQKQAEAPKAKAEARPRGGPPAGKAPAKKEKAAK